MFLNRIQAKIEEFAEEMEGDDTDVPDGLRERVGKASLANDPYRELGSRGLGYSERRHIVLTHAVIKVSGKVKAGHNMGTGYVFPY